MATQVEKQQDAVRRMKQSPCECIIYHPKRGTEIYDELWKEYMDWRNIKPSKSTVDKTWILHLLISSQECPYIKDETA